MNSPTDSPRFNVEADEALTKYYENANAHTVSEKIAALERVLGEAHFYAFGGIVDEKMKLGCLEYEYLSLNGLLDLEYV